MPLRDGWATLYNATILVVSCASPSTGWQVGRMAGRLAAGWQQGGGRLAGSRMAAGWQAGWLAAGRLLQGDGRLAAGCGSGASIVAAGQKHCSSKVASGKQQGSKNEFEVNFQSECFCDADKPGWPGNICFQLLENKHVKSISET